MNSMAESSYNLITILGATASGKTRLAVDLAKYLGGEIISADSRQVFRGMDIGSGKDLAEYGAIPYHLIDVADAGQEFSVYEFQQLFFRCHEDIISRGKPAILCGGTGLYLDAVLRGYRMVEAPFNSELREKLSGKSDRELAEILSQIKPQQHNTTDLLLRDRTIRALEIAEAERLQARCPEILPIHSVVFGIRHERLELRRRITERLKCRLENGMVEEVEQLHRGGVSWDRLGYYGLEYRYIALYLQGGIQYGDMVQQLNTAIHNFAKRQETWFRRLEKRGIRIHWLEGDKIMCVSTLMEIIG